jgi:predicted transcriptional regulator
MAKKRVRQISPSNLEIMNIVWAKGEVSVNDVFDAINAKRLDKLRRTTIQVQMNRLEDYGWLTHRKKGRTFFYSALVEEQKTRKKILNDTINRVFGGSRAELVKCMLENSDVSPEDIRKLRELLKKAGETRS